MDTQYENISTIKEYIRYKSILPIPVHPCFKISHTNHTPYKNIHHGILIVYTLYMQPFSSIMFLYPEKFNGIEYK